MSAKQLSAICLSDTAFNCKTNIFTINIFSKMILGVCVYNGLSFIFFHKISLVSNFIITNDYCNEMQKAN